LIHVKDRRSAPAYYRLRDERLPEMRHRRL
jgi:hypothetical protein